MRPVRERPTIFSGAMICAILDGRKSQTRRVMKPQPHHDSGTISVGYYHPTKVDRRGEEYPGEETFGAYGDEQDWPCPYGAPGDRLWVREGWAVHDDRGRVVYRADEEHSCDPSHCTQMHHYRRWKPSIHMSRAASRLTLEVTAVRAERLQSISEEDAEAEGAGYLATGRDVMNHTCTEAFVTGWDRINGKRLGCAWADDPYVWVVSFRRIP